MNERIKELAKEAGAYFGGGSTDYFGDYIPPYMSIKELDLEKFAELIVKECIMQVLDYVHINGMKDGITYFADDKISEHFGVEE